jgi:hypothetical protein
VFFWGFVMGFVLVEVFPEHRIWYNMMKKGFTNPYESLLVVVKGVKPEKVTSKDG